MFGGSGIFDANAHMDANDRLQVIARKGVERGREGGYLKNKLKFKNKLP